jgi:hypothetical protein
MTKIDMKGSKINSNYANIISNNQEVNHDWAVVELFPYSDVRSWFNAFHFDDRERPRYVISEYNLKRKPCPHSNGRL